MAIPSTMTAVRLHGEGIGGLRVETIDVPTVAPGEPLVQVHSAAITKDELEWPVDRLPATPCYELSGVVAAAGDGTSGVAVGDEVYAMTPFDRDGVAAEFAVVPAAVLSPKPSAISHDQSAAIPLPALSAWQALFTHGQLEAGQRVLVHGATGGVGQFATQLARWRGAHVIGSASLHSFDAARALGATEVFDGRGDFDGLEPVDLVFDTVGGDMLERGNSLLAPGGRFVSVAAQPAGDGLYFIVQPNGEQLAEIARLVDAGELRVAIDSTYPLGDATAAFERSLAPGKHGKVVFHVA